MYVLAENALKVSLGSISEQLIIPYSNGHCSSPCNPLSYLSMKEGSLFCHGSAMESFIWKELIKVPLNDSCGSLSLLGLNATVSWSPWGCGFYLICWLLGPVFVSWNFFLLLGISLLLTVVIAIHGLLAFIIFPFVLAAILRTTDSKLNTTVLPFP